MKINNINILPSEKEYNNCYIKKCLPNLNAKTKKMTQDET